MVRLILDYASIFWSPHTQKNIQVLESIQRRSVRFVFKNYSPYDSVSDMLTKLGWISLAERQNEHKLIMLYNLVDINADSLLPRRPCNHSTRGHPNRFLQLPARVNTYANSFFPNSIKMWNSLPYDYTNISDLNQFRQRIASNRSALSI